MARHRHTRSPAQSNLCRAAVVSLHERYDLSFAAIAVAFGTSSTTVREWYRSGRNLPGRVGSPMPLDQLVPTPIEPVGPTAWIGGHLVALAELDPLNSEHDEWVLAAALALPDMRWVKAGMTFAPLVALLRKRGATHLEIDTAEGRWRIIPAFTHPERVVLTPEQLANLNL